MAQSIRFASRTVRLPAVVGALVLGALLASSAPVQAQYAVPPIDEGQAYFMATHSFSVFIAPNQRTGEAGPLDRLAAEAQLEGHHNIGVQMIGGSTPMQHWNQGDGDDSKNLAKVALRNGGVDVFTISPNATMPEQGIDLFGDLMIETNPEGRILVQDSWSAWDGHGTTQSVGGNGGGDFTNADRDKVTDAEIQGWIEALHAPGGYLERMRNQLRNVNDRAGTAMAYVVPAADAVYRLRQEVIRGRIPGIEKQSQLFVDPIGHPATPVANLVTYLWFTVMYRQPASGLVALVDPNDPTSYERERLLQQIAWEAAANEPMSGVLAPTLWPDGARSMHELFHNLSAPTDDMEGMEHMQHGGH